MISKSAKEALLENPKTKLTKEHQFPRKIAAKEMLSDSKLLSAKESSILTLYKEKYAKFNFVTPSENKRISRHQKDTVFKDIETAYKNADIILEQLTFNELKQLRRNKTKIS